MYVPVHYVAGLPTIAADVCVTTSDYPTLPFGEQHQVHNRHCAEPVHRAPRAHVAAASGGERPGAHGWACQILVMWSERDPTHLSPRLFEIFDVL